MSDGLAQSLGIAAEVADANELCDYPAGRRFQPLTLALDNLTDCGTGNSNAAGGWSAPANWALLANGNPPSYVDNQHGARNFRSMYDDEHLDAMVEIAAAMRNVCGRGSNSDIEGGSCCVRQTDVLEAAGLIYDATELAKVGKLIGTGNSPYAPGSNMEPPLSRNNLTAARVLDMTERVIMTGGDPNDGEWQFIMGSAASDSLFFWKRVTDWLENQNCTVSSIVYVHGVLTRLGNQTANEWLDPATTPPTDVLKRMAGPRLLWQLGMIDDAQLTGGSMAPKMCTQFTKTNLWQRWVVAGAINGDKSSEDGLPSPSHDPSRGQEQPAPPNSDSVSIDLVPSLYMVGVAMPRDCNTILLNSAGRNGTGSSVGDLLTPLLQGTQNCVLFDEDPAEASRCLFAMPSVALSTNNASLLATAVTSTMRWLLTSGGEPMLDWPKQKLARFYQRKQMISDQLPAILTNMGRANPAIHSIILDYLDSSAKQGGIPTTMLCGILDTMAAPAAQKPYDKLLALLTTGNAKDCPAMLRMRVAGKAEHFKKLADDQGEDICAYVTERLAEWKG